MPAPSSYRHEGLRSPVLRTATATLLVLAACSTEEEMRAVDPAGRSDAPAASARGEMPTAVPAADGEVTTGGLVTVLDDGDGPRAVPRGGRVAARRSARACRWPAGTGPTTPSTRTSPGVRWGSFALTGTFDGTTFTVTDAVPAALYDALNEEPEPLPGTPCEPPAGRLGGRGRGQGHARRRWTPPSPRPRRLPGFAGTWMDQSQRPVADQTTRPR